MKPDKKAAMLNFLAGGLAGTVSSSLTAPLEVIKTQLQSSRVSGKLNPMQVCQEIINQQDPPVLLFLDKLA